MCVRLAGQPLAQLVDLGRDRRRAVALDLQRLQPLGGRGGSPITNACRPAVAAEPLGFSSRARTR